MPNLNMKVLTTDYYGRQTYKSKMEYLFKISVLSNT